MIADFLMIILFIVVTIYHIYKNREVVVKELTKFQIFGVGASYLVTIIFAFILIYYGGNWVAGLFSNIFFKNMVFLAIVCMALYLSVSILNRVLLRITNGVLPKDYIQR